MHTYAVINQRGGIGKTTTASALAAGLRARGYKTLLIDLDAQGNLSYTMRAEHSSPTIYEVLTGAAEPQAAIISSEQGDIIPSSPNMATADTTITETGKEYKLREAITTFKGKYKYIVIDTPPALGIATINALTAADSVIIPAQAEAFSLQGIGRIYNTIETVKRYCNPKLKIEGILLTRFEGNTTLGKVEAEQAEQTAEAMHTKVFTAKIRACNGIKEAQATRTSLYEYKPAAKVKNAVSDYTAFIDELLKGSK